MDRSDSNTTANVFSTVLELPTSSGAIPTSGSGARCSLLRDGELDPRRPGRPPVGERYPQHRRHHAEYNAGAPNRDRERWIGQFIHLMGRTGGYTREEAIAAIDAEGTLPDVLTFNPAKPAKLPERSRLHRRRDRLPDGVPDQGEAPAIGLTPHTDILPEFPYLGAPH